MIRYLFLFTMGFIQPVSADCVVLLHGLGRSAFSLVLLEEVLQRHGYKTVKVDYPSTKQTIQALSDYALPQGVCRLWNRKNPFGNAFHGGHLGPLLAGPSNPRQSWPRGYAGTAQSGQ